MPERAGRRVLLTGANGLLGQKAVPLLLGRGWSVFGTGQGDPSPCTDHGAPFRPSDLSDPASVRAVFEEAAPDAVFHAGAMTDVDGCEDEPGKAMAVNRDGTAAVARLCAGRGARMLYVSTEYVFDGADGPYGEEDEPRPLSAYGRSKYEGEQRARALADDLVVARTTVLFGLHCLGAPNFVTWLLDELEAGRPVRVVDDQVGSPTLADNLAEMTVALLLSGRRGLYNTVGRDVLDRCSFARIAARVFGLDQSLVRPVSTAELGQKAPRPLAAGLRTGKFEAHLPGVRVLSAEEALRELRRQRNG